MLISNDNFKKISSVNSTCVMLAERDEWCIVNKLLNYMTAMHGTTHWALMMSSRGTVLLHKHIAWYGYVSCCLIWQVSHCVYLLIVSVFLLIDICRQSAETGPCRARKTRYFYDVSIGDCRQFTYGGCNGNANRFLTIDNCRNVCRGVDHVPAETTQLTTKQWKIAKHDKITTAITTTVVDSDMS